MQTHGTVPSRTENPLWNWLWDREVTDSRDAAVELCPIGCFPGGTRIAPRGQYSPASSSTEVMSANRTDMVLLQRSILEPYVLRTLCPKKMFNNIPGQDCLILEPQLLLIGDYSKNQYIRPFLHNGIVIEL
jgi:hypothetical protein